MAAAAVDSRSVSQGKDVSTAGRTMRGTTDNRTRPIGATCTALRRDNRDSVSLVINEIPPSCKERREGNGEYHNTSRQCGSLKDQVQRLVGTLFGSP